jgi:hypothetical protein
MQPPTPEDTDADIGAPVAHNERTLEPRNGARDRWVRSPLDRMRALEIPRPWADPAVLPAPVASDVRARKGRLDGARIGRYARGCAMPTGRAPLSAERGRALSRTIAGTHRSTGTASALERRS